ncbi:transposable element Tcb1 transposase [Trichonephila clavipes]|nr:transposable element Tcb1 transposase [Trichonephila clavipes]
MHCGHHNRSCVMFSDESRFSLQSDSHRTLIWRAPGIRYHQKNIIERHRYGDAGWLVWGGIILGSRTDLHIQSVTMTGHTSLGMSFWNNMYVCFGAPWVLNFCLLMTTPVLTMQTLWTNAFNRRISPVWIGQQYSPDLNPIEHVWDIFGRRIAVHQPPSKCLPELRRALLDEWCNIPQDQIDNLILSMPRRCKACTASTGRHTPY